MAHHQRTHETRDRSSAITQSHQDTCETVETGRLMDLRFDHCLYLKVGMDDVVVFPIIVVVIAVADRFFFGDGSVVGLVVEVMLVSLISLMILLL